jgi:hypothetical protein
MPSQILTMRVDRTVALAIRHAAQRGGLSVSTYLRQLTLREFDSRDRSARDRSAGSLRELSAFGDHAAVDTVSVSDAEDLESLAAKKRL